MLNPPQGFDWELQDEALQEFDPFTRLREVVEWEQFRPVSESVLGRSCRRSRRGRPSWDVLLMFRVLVLGVHYHLSDRQLRFQLLDRRSFMRFAGRRNDCGMSDDKTICKYRNRLTESGRCKKLIEWFENQLRNRGYAMTDGEILDSTMVEVPRQRNTRD